LGAQDLGAEAYKHERQRERFRHNRVS